MGCFGEIWGMRDVLWACFWCALWIWRIRDVLGGCFWGSWRSLGVPWRSLGVLRVSLGRSLGVLGGPGSVLGSSWGALGVILEVWGDPWISPGRSECCYFIGFEWYSEMSCFFMMFYRNLEVMLLSRNMTNYINLTLLQTK